MFFAWSLPPLPALDTAMHYIPHSRYDWDWDRYGAWIEWIWHHQRFRVQYTVTPTDPSTFAGVAALTYLTQLLMHWGPLLSWGSLDTAFAPFRVTDSQRQAVLPDVFRQLGLTTWPQTLDVLKQAFYHCTQAAHPDHGGSHEAMVALNAAFAQAQTLWAAFNNDGL